MDEEVSAIVEMSMNSEGQVVRSFIFLSPLDYLYQEPETLDGPKKYTTFY